MSNKFLIVGLGNPGREYKGNRHNIGFMTVEALADRHLLSFSKLQSNAAVTSGHVSGQAVVLAKPQKYMNKSGQPVQSLANFYKIPLQKILVIYDDLDLPPGTLRLRPEGGSGGHNGMKDIINKLGSHEFPRLRMGIGRPQGRMDPAAYVLQDFGDDEMITIQTAMDEACDAIETWLVEGIQLAMSRHNGPVDD